jgi:hypothetical protein
MFNESWYRTLMMSCKEEMRCQVRIAVAFMTPFHSKFSSAALDDKASNLATMSQKYKKDAHTLNLKSSYAKIAAVIVILLIFVLFIRYWVF